MIEMKIKKEREREITFNREIRLLLEKNNKNFKTLDERSRFSNTWKVYEDSFADPSSRSTRR